MGKPGLYVGTEAADTTIYHPKPEIQKAHDVVWIGNWGDGEREAELREYLIDPVADLCLSAKIYGVRYSKAALVAIAAARVEYHGWLPAHRVPQAFASALAPRFMFRVHPMVNRCPASRQSACLKRRHAAFQLCRRRGGCGEHLS